MSENRTHVDPTLLRPELQDLSVQERADLLEKMVRAFYEGSKYDYPGGEGLDGRDGDEREKLAKVLDAAIAFQNYARQQSGQPQS